MNWPILASAAGGILACVNIASLFLANRMRADIAELKLWVMQQREADKQELRNWVDSNFVRKEFLDVLRVAKRAA